MPLRRVTPILAFILTAVLAACLSDSQKTAPLASALRVQYPTAHIDIRYANNDARHLSLTVDDSAKRTMSDSALQTQGRAIAHFVLDYYSPATNLDSITIMFVRERERHFLSGSYSGIAVRFATRDLR